MSTEYNELDRRVRKVETDFAGHDGRSAEFWDTQTRTNTATLRGLEKISGRADVLEKKFSWMWGLAAGATGLLATVATAMRIF